jgi:hypothetical protein
LVSPCFIRHFLLLVSNEVTETEHPENLETEGNAENHPEDAEELGESKLTDQLTTRSSGCERGVVDDVDTGYIF